MLVETNVYSCQEQSLELKLKFSLDFTMKWIKKNYRGHFRENAIYLRGYLRIN